MTNPHRNNSFSYKNIHPTIKSALNSRARLDNKVQMAMPFVKATTTLALPEVLGQGNIGFTLGLHAIKSDLTAQNIYSSAKGNALIGYTYTTNGETEPIYAQVYSRTGQELQFFDLGSDVYTDTNFSHIPPPGITNVTVGRIKNGVVSSAQIDFTVPTLPQLELLHRTFLVPGIGMILEWGQRFTEDEPDIGESGLTADYIRETMFPWYDRTKLDLILARLAVNEVGIDEIMNCYVHPTQGQYQWIFGRVANFSTKMAGDGSFNCSVKIVGPAENSWAYSVRNTVIPAAATAGGPVCIGDTNSVENYFTRTSSEKNFKTLLEGVSGAPTADGTVPVAILPDWKDHVQFFAQGNKKSGEADSTKAKTDESTFADSEDAYFITWRFFVNVVLNHPEYGIKGIFKDAFLTPQELLKTSVLRPYGDANNLDSPGENYIDDQYENFVGNNKFLRSTDPSTLIIVNEAAADESTAALDRSGGVPTTDPGWLYLEREVTQATTESAKFLALGDFFQSVKKVRENQGLGGISYNNDRGLLSAGVWLNHKAVIQAMVSANTIAEGLSNLLNRMNAATANFWNLTLDISEPFNTTESCGSTPTYTAVNYTIVDMNYRENAEEAVDKFINKDPVHVFNKYIRSINGALIGSDTLECNVDINLPKRLFSQIATLGLVQENETSESGGTAPIVGDPNDSLRKMFAITSISRNSTGQSADLTAPLYDRSGLTSAACGGTVSPPPAGAGTSGRPGPAPASADDANKDEDDLQEEIDELNEKLQKAPCSTVCKSQVDAVGASAGATSSAPGSLPLIGAGASSLSAEQRTNLLLVARELKAQALSSNPKYVFSVLCKVLAETGALNRYLAESKYNTTSPARIRAVFGSRVAQYTDAQLNVLKAEANGVKFFNVLYGPDASTGGVPSLGNRPGDLNSPNTDGYKYRGGGFIGITGRGNFQRYSTASGIDIISNPEILRSPPGAARLTAAFMKGTLQSMMREYGYTNINQLSQEQAHLLAVGQIAGRAVREPGKGFIGLEVLGKVRGFYATHFAPGKPFRAQVLAELGVPDPGDGTAPTPTFTPAPSAAAPTTPTAPTTPQADCSECVRIKQTIDQKRRQLGANSARNAAVGRVEREFPNLQKIFRYVEIFTDWMVSSITRSADDNSSNAFGSAPGSLSINAEITLPGINGLRVGELFWIDKIPTFYRALGAFQIINIEDTIGPDGWKTKINAKFNYLGRAWRDAVKTKFKINY